MNIFVGNLDYQVSEEELKEFFSSQGEVESARIIANRHTGRSKGFGFVVMPNDDEANKAIEELNGKELNGRPLTVSEARRPEEDRSGFGSSRGDGSTPEFGQERERGRRDRY